MLNFRLIDPSFRFAGDVLAISWRRDGTIARVSAIDGERQVRVDPQDSVKGRTLIHEGKSYSLDDTTTE